MFNQSVDQRLTTWVNFRTSIEDCTAPLVKVWEFWKSAPFVPYNSKIDPYFEYGWPTPWEIIIDNRYDDFTKSLMIGWTLKLTKRYEKGKIEIKTAIDNLQSKQYNIVYVDDQWVINYNDNGPELIENLPKSFFIENIVEVKKPR